MLLLHSNPLPGPEFVSLSLFMKPKKVESNNNNNNNSKNNNNNNNNINNNINSNINTNIDNNDDNNNNNNNNNNINNNNASSDSINDNVTMSLSSKDEIEKLSAIGEFDHEDEKETNDFLSSSSFLASCNDDNDERYNNCAISHCACRSTKSDNTIEDNMDNNHAAG